MIWISQQWCHWSICKLWHDNWSPILHKMQKICWSNPICVKSAPYHFLVHYSHFNPPLRATATDLPASSSGNKEVCGGHQHRCHISHHQWHQVSVLLLCICSEQGKMPFNLPGCVFRYIIDSGFVKQLNHNSRVGMDILEVVPISKWVLSFFLLPATTD